MIGNHLEVQTGIISMRPVLQSDARLIYDLRHSKRGSWLKPTSTDIRDQEKYLKDYLIRFEDNDEVYYVIRDLKLGLDLGVTRITKLNEPEIFGWEGLIISEEASPGVAIDLVYSIYKIGFELLGKKLCGPWGVRKDSERVIRLHQVMGIAEIVSEDEVYWFYHVTSESFFRSQRYFESRGFGNFVE